MRTRSRSVAPRSKLSEPIILDLIAVLGGQGQLPPAPQVAAVGLPVAPTVTVPQGGANAPISGIVQDRSKALIPGVKVTATNVDTGESQRQ